MPRRTGGKGRGLGLGGAGRPFACCKSKGVESMMIVAEVIVSNVAIKVERICIKSLIDFIYNFEYLLTYIGT